MEKEESPFFGIDPTGKSPKEIELEWCENHYHGDVPQLTVRAVLVGAILGGFMSLSNLYVGLKTGWGLGTSVNPESLPEQGHEDDAGKVLEEVHHDWSD